jgi:hypothetical protein
MQRFDILRRRLFKKLFSIARELKSELKVHIHDRVLSQASLSSLACVEAAVNAPPLSTVSALRRLYSIVTELCGMPNIETGHPFWKDDRR